MKAISSEEFTERFVELILGAREMPRKPLALHVLLLSSVLSLEAGRR
jgi:hypothetical protein